MLHLLLYYILVDVTHRTVLQFVNDFLDELIIAIMVKWHGRLWRGWAEDGKLWSHWSSLMVYFKQKCAHVTAYKTNATKRLLELNFTPREQG